MEKSVRTVFAPHESEKIIEKSRFLTYSEHVESEEEARAFLAKIRKMHSLATHVCYAFIADKTGNLQRFSDDGEPQGTAGVQQNVQGIALTLAVELVVEVSAARAVFAFGILPRPDGKPLFPLNPCDTAKKDAGIGGGGGIPTAVLAQDELGILPDLFEVQEPGIVKL